MSFLAPLWLLLAAAGGIPLVMHLMRRNISARVDFPAARYLQRAEQEHSRSLRLRNLLLMLLRVLLVVALALAASRPFVRGVGTGHGPTALAIVLDNSLSTSARSDGAPVVDRLRDGAAAVLRATTDGDRLWLVTADGDVRGGTREHLLAELPRIGPLETAGNLALALRRATAAVAAADLPSRAIAVATDGQMSAWRAAPRVPLPVSVFVPAVAPPANRAVIAADAEPPRWTPRGVVSFQLDASRPAPYRVMLGDRTVARGATTGAEIVRLPLATTERGWVAGRVEIDADDFPADDQRWFAFWAGPAPSITADVSAGSFVTTALGVLVAEGRATTGAAVHVAAADAVPALPALIVPPADPLRLGAANRALERLGVPWRFGAVTRAPVVAQGALVDGAAVTERYELHHTRAGAADTLATAGGAPWIVAGPGYVLVGSRLDPAATALPVRAAFVPWLEGVTSQALAATVGDLRAPLTASPGDPLPLPEGADTLESMDGARIALVAATAHAPAARGVWFVRRQGRRIGALVVNAPPGESALARFSARALADRIGGQGGGATTRVEALAPSVFRATSRHAAALPLLLVALLLFVTEALVVRVARRSATPRSTRQVAS